MLDRGRAAVKGRVKCPNGKPALAPWLPVDHAPSMLHNRNLRREGNRHQNGAMWCRFNLALAFLLSGLAFSTLWAQDARSSDPTAKVSGKHKKDRTLTSDERLAVIASALDSKTPRRAERDCSHLVHAIYERAGFPYSYADSDDIYAGVEGFQRVSKPQPGDVIVWHGHMGIVIRPSRHVFFSFLHAGPGIDDYKSQYWTGRGEPRFYRYVKNDRCAGCTLARSKNE